MSSNPGRNRHRLYLLGSAVTILLVYFSSLHADYLPIDDGGVLQTFQSGDFSISDFFLHGGKEYYRPLAALSLLGDFYLFGGKTSGYHITNVLIHLCNTLLIYYLTSLLLKGTRDTAFYSFIAGLIFAVHPVNSETVVWISCRPDLLCCLFSLLSLVIVIKSERITAPAIFISLFFVYICSLLAKEASFFLPLIIVYYYFQERKYISTQKTVAASAAISLAIGLYLLLRKGLPHISATGETLTAKHGVFSSQALLDIIAAFGFYIRKLLFPFPLNFTITEINSTLYASLLIIFIAAAVFLRKNSTGFRFPILFLATSLIPPIGAMLLIPIWTPYAERYLYLPSVAFALCATCVIYRFGKRIPHAIVTVCVLALAFPTALRVQLWTKPLPFWQDAVSKAPNFATSRLVLASEYLKSGDYQKAEENLRLAVRLGLHKKSLEPSIEIKKQLEMKTGRIIEFPSRPGKVTKIPIVPHMP
ncbi:MAG: hypothetical protein EG822_04020 [Deltaproteobacteria bacterium]|nr:hypothetical protein [Deltaproteobacteria bacterium]TLN03231.1 MAG: hypothetical protein FDZ73_08695 [bacterium]